MVFNTVKAVLFLPELVLCYFGTYKYAQSSETNAFVRANICEFEEYTDAGLPEFVVAMYGSKTTSLEGGDYYLQIETHDSSSSGGNAVV